MDGVKWEGVPEFRAALSRLIAASSVGNRMAVQTTAAALIKQAKLNATGPARRGKRRVGTGGITIPWSAGGPGVVTGRLRNSITVLKQGADGIGYSADVGPTVIYSRRIELGFTGEDSMGRHYNQPPYPYFRPAFTYTMTVAAPILYREAWRKALGLPKG